MTQGPQSSGYGVSVIRGVTDHIDQNIDDPRRLQLHRDSGRSELLPLGPLRGSPLWFGAEVKVSVLELLSGQRVILDEKTKRIVHTQLQQILKLAVGLACRRYLDEVDHGCAQCSTPAISRRGGSRLRAVFHIRRSRYRDAAKFRGYRTLECV